MLKFIRSLGLSVALFAGSTALADPPGNASMPNAAAAATGQVSADVTVEYKSLDEPAKKAAAEIDSRLRAEMDKLRKDGVFLGITGTYKPSSEVRYLGTTPLSVMRDGKPVGALAVYYALHARVKLDAGGGPFTTKVAAVDTEQMLRVVIVPVIKDGHLTVEMYGEVTRATASKERQAHQSDANKLRDGVKTRVTQEINKILGENQVLPQAVREFDRVSGVTVDDTRFTVRVGEKSNGYATDKSSDKAKLEPAM